MASPDYGITSPDLLGLLLGFRGVRSTRTFLANRMELCRLHDGWYWLMAEVNFMTKNAYVPYVNGEWCWWSFTVLRIDHQWLCFCYWFGWMAIWMAICRFMTLNNPTMQPSAEVHVVNCWPLFVPFIMKHNRPSSAIIDGRLTSMPSSWSIIWWLLMRHYQQ